jgi:hypothetical protein
MAESLKSSAQGENMDGMIYRGYRIASAAHHSRETDQWTAETIILERRGTCFVEHVFPAGKRFATKQAAERASIAFGKRVLDGKVPGVTL